MHTLAVDSDTLDLGVVVCDELLALAPMLVFGLCLPAFSFDKEVFQTILAADID